MSKIPFSNLKFGKLEPVLGYKLRYAFFLTSIPIFCTILLLLLLSVFSKLNLYYLESIGLIVNPDIRTAYYDQVIVEILEISPYLILLYTATFALCCVVMRWATNPFTSAEKKIRLFLENPKNKLQSNKWMSESPELDSALSTFISQVDAKKFSAEKKSQSSRVPLNLPFLGKFIFIFTIISVTTGMMLGILLNSTYEKVVSLALHLVKSNASRGYYFIAQQEILNDGVKVAMIVSFVLYILMGIRISRYMSEMIGVFTQSIHEQRFPLRLRTGDIYQGFAKSLSEAAKRCE